MNDTEKLDLLIQEVGSLRDEIQAIQRDISILHISVKNTESHMENVIDKNIYLLAEGHLNLKNKLSEAVKASNYAEMLGLRVNILEGDVRMLKEHIQV